jgi:Tol biopolymer transport system component
MTILLGSGTTSQPGTLARMPLSGGAPREILENVNGVDWSPDGRSLAVSHSIRGLNRIEYPIGVVLYESSVRLGPFSLRASPRGDLLAFFEYDEAVGDFALTLLDLQGRKRVLTRGWRGIAGLVWSPKADEIWFGGTRQGGEPALRAVTLSGKERTVFETSTWLVIDDATRDGRVLVESVDSRMGISCLAPGSSQESDLSWFEGSRVYDISADGRKILFVELSYGQARNTAVYLRQTDGSAAVRLGDCNRPALSSDGKLVTCIFSEGLQTRLMVMPTGPGEVRNISTEGMHYEHAEWFPDGRRILFTGNEPHRPLRTFIQDLAGTKPTPVTRDGLSGFRVSPDAKKFLVTMAGKLTLYPLDGSEPKSIADINPGESVIGWSGDGRYIFLEQLEKTLVAKIYRLDMTTGRKELWKELMPTDPAGLVSIRNVVMTPDGESYAYSFQRDIASLYLIKGLK